MPSQWHNKGEGRGGEWGPSRVRLKFYLGGATFFKYFFYFYLFEGGEHLFYFGAVKDNKFRQHPG